MTRWRKKNGVQDLEKALHFLDKFIETEEKRISDVTLTTLKFLDDNGVERYERGIILELMHYQSGGVGTLLNAKQRLQGIINDEKLRLAEKGVA